MMTSRSGGLKKQTVHGVTWAIGSSLANQCILMCVTVIVARILEPRDYGVYGIALVAIAFLQLFAQLGMGSALIRAKELSEECRSSVFWVNVATGVILCVIYIGCASEVARFFRVPELKSIMRVLSFNFILASLTIVHSTILAREMRFKNVSIISLCSVIISGIIAIIFAIRGFGVWSLVWSSVGQLAVMTVLLWILSPWKPKWIFKVDAIKGIFVYSANVLGCNIISYLCQNVQNIAIGRYISPVAFGYYSIADRVVSLPLQQIISRASCVVFPAYSQIQDEPVTLRRAYLQTSFLLSVVSLPLMAGICVTAPELVTVLIGAKWASSIVLLQILCLSGVVASIASPTGPLMLSQGRADMQLRFSSIGFLVRVVAVAIGIRWGVVGVAIGYTCGTVILYPIVMFFSAKLIGLSMRRYLMSVFPAGVVTALMLSILTAFRWYVKPLLHVSDLWYLIVSICFGMLMYSSLFVSIFPREFAHIVAIVKMVLPSRAK